MEEKSRVIFGNQLSDKVYRKAVKSKKKYMKKFGDDSQTNYPVIVRKNPVIGDSLGVQDIRIEDGPSPETFDHEKGIIVGNIRMGFGHYRISMAMASAAKALGYTPYWLDLNSFPETTCTKVISYQNDLYSLGSRLSKIGLFNKLVWEPVNYEGFRALSYNAADQKNAELMVPVFRNIPKDIPLIGTHVWPAQAAIHADMKYVVNAIPDNWPMALHLAEGALHTIQTRNSYQGYKILNGMQKDKVNHPMPNNALYYTGHYIDHELVSNIDSDCQKRMARKKENKPMRFLLTIGGAGAQKEIFEAIIKYLLPLIRTQKAALYVNVGDYKNVWEDMVKALPEMKDLATEHFEDFKKASAFAADAIDGEVDGIHAFYHKDIFEAVYITNLLMRSCDVLVTKPSELAFYPVPKLFIRRVGKHEMWGAIHSSEMGDGTLECRDIPHTLQMLDIFLQDDNMLAQMCDAIRLNNSIGLYNGAYNVVKLAMGLKSKQ
ncbi:MAG: hypothetical protein PUF56_06020 [Lachnospiraceae bacterium]|nr:hypothetical protein [Lachnospiraceae bacterium]MDD6451476.1 hypothetical protein [Lachnospiraceae bacterium]MDD6578321.1 hypothetical protein [Lachnospiraceae bacterium]